MEKQYSVEFFQTFVNNLQELCMNQFNFDKYVEVTGYISVEIDDVRKERYVVSEMLSNGGHAVSESYCIKAFRTGVSGNDRNVPIHTKSMKRPRSMQMTREPKRQQSTKEDFHGSRTYVPFHDNSSYTDHVVEMDEDFDTHVNVSRQGSSETARSSQVSEEDHLEVYPRLDCRAGSKFDNQQGISCNEARSKTHEEEVLVNLPNRWNSSDMVEVKPEHSSSMDDDDVIDLDLYEDDLDDSQFVSSPTPDRCPIDSQSSNAPSSSTKRKQMATGNDQLQSNPYVEKVTRFSVKKLKKFYFDNGGDEQDFFLTPPEKLDTILSGFFSGMRKKDGSPYEPGTLRTMQCHIDKYLKNGGYSWSLLKDDQFRGSRDVLKSLLGDRVKVKPHVRHNPVTEQDIEVLFNTEQLGLFNAESLLNTMWFINSCFFGIKSLSEHFNLKWGEVILQVDENGREYLHRVMNGGMPRGPKLYAKPMNVSRCFVHMFKQYSAARPSWCMDSTSSFYLNLNKNLSINAWYLSETLNWHKLSFLWKKILTVGGLPQDKKPVLSVVGSLWNGHQ